MKMASLFAHSLVCLSLIIAPTAHGQAPVGSFLEAISPDTRLHLIGSGVQNRSTGDSIALACVNECTQIRFAYFRAKEKDAYFYGAPIPVISVHDEPTPNEIKEAVKQQNKKYRKALRQEKKKRLAEKRIWVFLVLFIGAGVLYGTGMGTTMLGLSHSEMVSGLVLIWAGGAAILSLIKNRPLFSARAKFTEAFYDQNGWNWEVAPNRVGPRKFKHFKTYSDPTHELNSVPQIVLP